jgi:hypothetical protein
VPRSCFDAYGQCHGLQVPEHRVQVNVAMCPRGDTGRMSSVAVVTLRQIGHVTLTVVMMIVMVLTGPDAAVGP